jgi:uncharacterized phage protein gp47/JayE
MIEIPTTQELYVQIKSELETEFNITIPDVGPNYLRTQAQVLAAELRLYYLYAGKVQKNIFADTADPESMGGTLERFGRVKLGRDPFKATAGKYLCVVTGDAGAVIPANTVFKSDDDTQSPNKLYVLDSAYTMPGVSGQILLRALESGLDSQLSVSDTLSSTAPIPQVDTTATVQSEDTEPIAAESVEEYREKVIEAFRLEPQGGAQADYVLWSNEVQGVAESYPYTSGGNTNEVDLYIEATEIDSTDGKGTPSAQLITDVQSSIEDPTPERPSRKPISTIVNYLPITPLDIIITISNYIDLTPAKETLIQNALKNYFSEIRPFLSGVDVVGEKIDTVTLNNISSVVLDAVPGSIFDTPQLDVDGNIVPSYQFEDGDIPFLNPIIYI